MAKNVLNFTHVSGDKLGTNLFVIDFLKSDKNDPANGSEAGATEWYGFYKRSFSLSALTGNKGGYGFAKDLYLTGRVDLGAKNTAFAPAPAKLRTGVSADLPVKAGFWNVGLEVYKEQNNNSLASAGKRAVDFDPTLALTSSWSIPVAGLGSFDGFLDVVGPKGKDGFGNETATEVLLRATMMFDIAGPKSGLQAGVGVEYWGNKFGCDNSKNGTTSGGTTNTCKSVSPLLLATYKF
ncbi:MAG: hypothetical protein ACK5RC_05840 [Curvibacter sp.]